MVTFEGKLSYKDDEYCEEKKKIDVIYNLEKHLNKNFKLSLKNLDSWNNEIKKYKLFRYKKQTISNLFAKRAEEAGYPHRIFSFHSLRSGFLCSALAKAGTDDTKVKGVMEATAQVADWDVYGNSQQRYIKDNNKKLIICNRLIDYKPLSSLIEKNEIDPEYYHHINLIQPNNKRIFIKRKLFELIKKYLLQTMTLSSQFAFMKLFIKYSNEYCEDKYELKKKIDKSIQNFKCYHHYKNNFTQKEYHIRKKWIIKYLISKLNENYSNLEDVCSSFLKCKEEDIKHLEDYKNIEPERIIVNINNHYINNNINNNLIDSYDINKSNLLFENKRRPFTFEEDELIKRCKKERMGWTEIARLLEDRTWCDVKDRWRNMKQKYKIFKKFDDEDIIKAKDVEDEDSDDDDFYEVFNVENDNYKMLNKCNKVVEVLNDDNDDDKEEKEEVEENDKDKININDENDKDDENDDEFINKTKRKRGRPKKVEIINDNTCMKKKKGRPKKNLRF